MHFPAPALAFALLSLLPSTLAAGTCASSGSLAWPPVGECNTPNKYPTAVQTCRACCLNDQPCFTACLKAAGIGARDVLPTAGMIEATEVKKRAVALTCATNEGCYKFTDGSLLCLNLGTGLYHDDVGGNGDFFSGKYTGPDGRVQTGTGTMAASASPVRSSGAASQATRSAATTTAQGTRTTAAGGPASSTGAVGASAGGASASAGAASASTASAKAAASSAAAGYVGANVGLVGLVAGLII